ncbi:Hypothetical predicted protein, partial [Mytilus galloprovincialis]
MAEILITRMSHPQLKGRLNFILVDSLTENNNGQNLIANCNHERREKGNRPEFQSQLWAGNQEDVVTTMERFTTYSLSSMMVDLWQGVVQFNVTMDNCIQDDNDPTNTTVDDDDLSLVNVKATFKYLNEGTFHMVLFKHNKPTNFNNCQ